MTALVIVESPAKAKSIAGYLGDDYMVESSIGHIRDLPRNAADVPAAYKGEKWSRMGIDVDNDFKPLYVVSSDKKDQIKKLKAMLKDADELYLATDEDREGEAIAWHLLEVLNPKVPVKRMVFHEITKTAILEAIDNPREIDRHLVDAQETRRMLDRLFGYEVSPVLWKKVMPRLSAGRVQSVATRIVVERERERMAFVRASYWDLEGRFSVTKDVPAGEPTSFSAKLLEIDSARVASGKDFDDTGRAKDNVVVLGESDATTLVSALEGASFEVRSVEPKPYRRRPAAPFMTATFQQEAGRKLKLSSAMAMRGAQGLYEKGYITYMRTDSTTLSATALSAARDVIKKEYGENFMPAEPRIYATKSKNAQEAHEAIRPAGDTFKSPAEVAREVPKSEAAVYELIWKRTVASQMTDATGETISARVGTTASDGRDVVFSASGTIISHQGFRRVYVEETDGADDTDGGHLPPLAVQDGVIADEITGDGHETQPPSRYTEASLVKRLAELEIGRPSTYASIINTIQDREYVWKKGSALIPSFTAFSVVGLLEEHFPDLVDYTYTKRMEEDLDAIAGGSGEAIPWLHTFYFGDEQTEGLKHKVDERLGEIDARAINSIPLGVTADGEMVVARVGKFGPYVQRGESDTASIPDDIPPDELTVDKAVHYIEEAAKGPKTLGDDPETGMAVYVMNGRFGAYVQLGEMVDGEDKPKRASLFANMTTETIELEDALKLLALPRVVGVDPADNVEITVQNGRYGPYLKKEKDSRSLETEDQLFTITLEQCLEILSKPKQRRGAVAKPPLREMGVDEESGKPMVIKDGRFGPYVTDGETNASLRKGDTVEEMTDDRASELLAIRRAAPPRKKKAPAKKKKAAAKKKAPAKKKAATKKKAAAKTPTETD
ncbi:MAG: type I DNA topoisomerase [Acidimicrobiales bacterium]|nr:type I DNA topoisomerase [Acidimicrobiales bacterium]